MVAGDPLTHGINADARYVIDGEDHVWVLESWEPNKWAYLYASEVFLDEGRLRRYRDVDPRHPQVPVANLLKLSRELTCLEAIVFLLGRTITSVHDHLRRPWRN